MKELIIKSLTENQFFQGGFVLTLFGSVVVWLRSFIPFIQERIERKFKYFVSIESTDHLYNLFNKFLSNNYNQVYKQVQAFISYEDNSKYSLGQNNINSSFIIWYKKVPLIITANREKLENASNMYSATIYSYNIVSWFSNKAVKELLNDLIDKHAAEITKKETLPIYTYDGVWVRHEGLNVKPIDKIFNTFKKSLIIDLEKFYNSKEEYKRKGIPFRRSYLLYGPPGNSKTSTILALAQKFNQKVQLLNLNDLGEKSILNAIRGIVDGFVVLEDVDCLLNDRKVNDKLSFSTLLNVLDGAYSKDNICVFMTTNHISKLDDALIRPGRIDKRFLFDNPCKEDVENMIELFFNEKVKMTNYSNQYSGAEIQEKLISSDSTTEFISKLI